MAETTQRPDWVRLEQVLEDNGIDPADFEKLAVRVIEQAWRAPASPDPMSTFTADEVTILTEGGLDLAPRRRGEPDILLQTATGLAAVEGKAASASEVAVALQVSATRVRQRAVERSLFAIRVDNEWRFPRWQFGEDGQPLPGISAVAAAVPPDVHPLAVWRFMSEPSPDLEIVEERVSPLDWLRAGGDPAAVISVAREL